MYALTSESQTFANIQNGHLPRPVFHMALPSDLDISSCENWVCIVMCDATELYHPESVSFYHLQYVPPNMMPWACEELPQPPSHRDAVVNSFCFVHNSLHQANTRLAKRGGRVMAITPRHYLDFINHFVSTPNLGSSPGLINVSLLEVTEERLGGQNDYRPL